MKRLTQRIILSVLGIMLISFSASCFYVANLGSDPYQVFMIGVHKTLNISYGNANLLLNLIILTLLFIFKRHFVKPALFISTILSGFFIDLFVPVVQTIIPSSATFGLNILVSLFAVALLAFGVYIYLIPQLGASPADSVGLVICETTGLPYKHIRIGTDVSYALIGLILGGTLGITTLIAVFLTGPLIGIYEKFFGVHKLA